MVFILKQAAILLIMWSFYHFFLSKEKTFVFNRIYLLVIVFISILIPLNTITVYPEWVNLPDFVVNEGGGEMAVIEETAHWSLAYLKYLIGFGYLAGVIFFGYYFYKNIQKILKAKRNGTTIRKEGFQISLQKTNTPIHSFGNTIFVSQSDYQNDEIDTALLQHELIHVRQKHTIDIIFIELMQVVFWFNPVFIWLKSAIRLNHEYLADESASSVTPTVAHYEQLLVNYIIRRKKQELSSYFKYSFTKKRINMLSSSKSKMKAIVKQLVIIPLLLALFFTFSSQVIAQNEAADPIPVTILNGKDVTNSIKYKYKGTLVNPASLLYMIQQKGEKVVRHLTLEYGGKSLAVKSPEIVQALKPTEAIKKYGQSAKAGAIVINGAMTTPAPQTPKGESPPPPPPPPPAPKNWRVAPVAPVVPIAPEPSTGNAPLPPVAPAAPKVDVPLPTAPVSDN
jgi:hypothetical protein